MALEKEVKELKVVQSQYMILMEHNQRIESENQSLRKQAADLNEESKEYKSELSEIQMKYQNLLNKLKNKKEIDLNSWNQWNADTITDWIVGLSQEYKAYDANLRTKMNEESLNGKNLVDLDRNDLDRFGIKRFQHKLAILEAIKGLTMGNDNIDSMEIQKEGVNQTPYLF